ncbi:hypothetical protein BYT27DRAFT_7235725 [Phlegmacium glaucopus]|nr:hypothetical protein BYT27DRAFT_7235725 [Phlegmacium glaucopus]
MEPSCVQSSIFGNWRLLSESHSNILNIGKQVSDHVTSLYTRYRSFPTQKKIYGREEFINQVIKQIHHKSTPLTLFGAPGIGKSAVASAVVHDKRIFEYFGHRRHWAHFGGITTLEKFLDILYGSLVLNADGYTADFPIHTSLNSSKSEQVNALISVLHTKTSPRLLVLNDFEGIWDRERVEIEPILQAISAVHNLTVLITMQGALAPPPSVWRLEITALSPRDAKLLFLTLYPRSDSALDELLMALDYLPLAIVLVAYACQTYGVKPSVLVDRWRKGKVELLEFEGKSLEASINSSMQTASMVASPSAGKLLRILTMLPAGILADDLATIAPSISNIDEITGMLTNMSLASVHQGRRIGLLSPVKAHVVKYQQLDDDSRRNVYFYHFKLAEEGLKNPGDSLFVNAMRKLVQNQRNIEAVLTDALENGCIPAIEATLQYSSPRCAIKPRVDILEKAVRAAIAEEASKPEIIARQDGTMSLTARCLQRLGEVKIDAGDYEVGAIKEMDFDRDYFPQAIQRFRKLGDSNAIAYCQIYVAQRIWINKPEEGIQHLEKARDDFVAMGDAAGAAKCDLKLGGLYLGSRHKAVADQAHAACQRALAQSNDTYHTALCNKLLSRIHMSVGQYDDAHPLLDAALKTLQKSGDRAAVADCLKSLAHLHIHSRRLDDACAALRQAIAELTWLGRDLDAAFIKWHLGDMCDDEEAVKLYQEAIPQFHASAFVFADAECRWDLGRRYMEMGSFSDAILHLEISRYQMILNETLDKAAMCLMDIIKSMCNDGNIEGAKLMLEQKSAEILSFVVQQEDSKGIQEGDVGVGIENGRLMFYLQRIQVCSFCTRLCTCSVCITVGMSPQ